MLHYYLINPGRIFSMVNYCLSGDNRPCQNENVFQNLVRVCILYDIYIYHFHILPIGNNCDTCDPGHFLSSDGSTLCDTCACSPTTSFDQNCNLTTGQCNCRDTDVSGVMLGIGGRSCEECIDGYFLFSTSGYNSNCTLK